MQAHHWLPGIGWVRGNDYRRAKGNFWGWYLCLLSIVVMVHKCSHITKLTKLYTLNMCHLSYINYTSEGVRSNRIFIFKSAFELLIVTEVSCGLLVNPVAEQTKAVTSANSFTNSPTVTLHNPNCVSALD